MFDKNAAIYCRSTKNEHGCSIIHQIKELEEYAEQKGLTVVRQYLDDTISGLSANRPGLSALLQDIQSPNRNWEQILIYDTSRLSRDNQMHFQTLFKIECDRYDITISYKTIPDSDPITEHLITTMLQATDAWFSMLSGKKGREAMIANALEGYWVGGRAPFGYDLQEIPVNKLGKTVTKKRLILNKDAKKMGEFLSRLAMGEKGAVIAEDLNLGVSRGTINGWKWQALTYAGCLVWNKTNPREANKKGYKGKKGKYRPIEEWIITPDCHEALISRSQAEVIMRQLKEGRREIKSRFLLSGILKTPDGKVWHGNSDNRCVPPKFSYRLKTDTGGSKQISKDAIELPILKQIKNDLNNPLFVDLLFEEFQKSQKESNFKSKLRANDKQIKTLKGQQQKIVDLLLEDNASIKILMVRLNDLKIEVELLEKQNEHFKQMNTKNEFMSKSLIKEYLSGLLLNSEIPKKDLLRCLIGWVSLDLNLQCIIYYKLSISNEDGGIGASPRGTTSIPVKPILFAERSIKL